MVMRIGGLASGMDIDALVEKLMTAERTPLNKIEQRKTTYEWQRDAYRDVNAKLKTFDTYIADNLVLKTLNSKTASSSNSSLVTATATGKATGSLSIEGVSQLATAASVVGTQQPITKSMQLSEVFAGGSMPSKIELSSINAQGNLNSPVAIELKGDMTVDQLVSKINSSNAGLTAVFENGQFSITAKNTGRVSTGESAIHMNDDAKALFEKFGIIESNIKEGQNARFIVNGIATERSSNAFTVNGYNIILNSTFNEKAVYDAFNTSSAGTLNTAQTQLTKTFNQLNSNAEYTVDLTNTITNADKYTALAAKIEEIINDKKAIVESKNTALKESKSVSFAKGDANVFLASLTEEQKEKFQAKALTESEIEKLGLTEQQKEAYNNLTDDEKASLTKTAGKMYDSLSKEAKELLGTLNHSDDLTDVALPTDQKEILNNLTADEFAAIKNVNSIQQEVMATSTDLNNTTKDLQNLNSKYTAYQQAQTTTLTIGTEPKTENKVASVTLTSTTNLDETVDKIKDFVKTYNSLVKELNDKTKESKYRDYAPLTAEQKKEMEENEIKLWEEKAKSGLLRNDSMIRDGLSNMRSLIYQTNPSIGDSRFNTLFSVGITTSKSYNDGGTLEIDEAKLRKALEENPDAVEQLFKNVDGKKDDVIDGKTVDTRGYLDKLRESMKNLEINIEKKAGRSTMTNGQYSIGKNLMDLDTRIKTWQDKLKNIEARYWKQFGAMESAINKANQQSAMLFSGQGQ